MESPSTTPDASVWGGSPGGGGDVWEWDAGGEGDAGSVAQPEGGQVSDDDAAVADGGVSGDGSAPDAGDLLGEVGKFLTCKPEEINPVVDCVTVKCAMESDPFVLLGCLTGECVQLVDKVDPRCGECVLAGIAQDTLGLLTSCLDTSPLFGDGGLSL